MARQSPFEDAVTSILLESLDRTGNRDAVLAELTDAERQRVDQALARDDRRRSR